MICMFFFWRVVWIVVRVLLKIVGDLVWVGDEDCNWVVCDGEMGFLLRKLFFVFFNKLVFIILILVLGDFSILDVLLVLCWIVFVIFWRVFWRILVFLCMVVRFVLFWFFYFLDCFVNLFFWKWRRVVFEFLMV